MIEERTKANLTNLWTSALLFRLSETKKFPKSPAALWGDKSIGAGASDQALLNVAKTMERTERESTAPQGARRRRRTGTILREE